MIDQVFIELTLMGAKAAVVYRKGDGLIFKQLRWHPFVGGWEGVAEATKLAAWTKTWLPRGKKVTLIIPRQMVLNRVLTLPSQDIIELKRMVALQLGEHIPYNIEEVVWDISLMGTTGNGFSQVMVWVVQQKDLMRWIDPLAQVGVKFGAVTLNISGLSDQIQLYQQDHAKAYWQMLLVVDVTNTECIFVKDNQQLFLRSLNFGFSQLQEPTESFTAELVLTIKDFLRNYPQEELNHISVISTAALPKWFEQWCVRQSLIYNSIDSNTVSKEKKCIIPDIFNQEGISLTAIVGLASVESKQILNLTPSLLTKREELVMQKSFAIQSSVLAGIIVILVLLAWQMPVIQDNIQLNQLRAITMKQQKRVKEIDELRQHLDEFKQLQTGTVSFAKLARAIEEGLGGMVFLNTLSINSDQLLSLEGYGREGVDLDGVQSRLSSSGVLKDVKLGYVNKRVTQEGQWVYFRMTMSLKTKED